MKICHYVREVRLELGGVVRAVLDFTGGLAAAGQDVTLITTYDEDATWEQDGPKPRVVRVGPTSARGGRFPRAELERIRPIIAEADVLHLHGVWLSSNVQLARIAREVGTPYVWSTHGVLDDWSMSQRRLKKRLFLALWGRRALEQAAFVVCTAQDEARQVAPWIGWGRTRVLLLIMDMGPFGSLPGPDLARRSFPDVDWDQPVLLFLSRLNYKKGADRLLDAAARLRDQGARFQVVVAGTGEDEQALRAQADRLGLGARVHFVGFASGATKVSLFEASDLFVLPTSQENFGFVLFEALAAGTPVMTTKGVDPWPELQSSGAGIICDSTPEVLASELKARLEDLEGLAAMGAKGRAWVFEHLATGRVVSELIKAYEDAVAERAPGKPE